MELIRSIISALERRGAWMKNITFALECPVHFLVENRSQAYKLYVWRGSESKNVLGAKNGLAKRALPVLERRGA